MLRGDGILQSAGLRSQVLLSFEWVVVVAMVDLQSHKTHEEWEDKNSLRGNRGARPSSK